MVDKPQTASDTKTPTPAAPATPAVPGTPGTPVTPPMRRGPGHRSHDVRDTVAEMAARAQELSLEAGSKMAAAMKDVINAAAGITGFAVESARDLVQYMVRRGQMTQDEADKLIREAEDAQKGRKPVAGKPGAPKPFVKAPLVAGRPAGVLPAVSASASARPVVVARPAARPAPARAAAKPVRRAAKPSRPAAKASKSASRKSIRPAKKKR